MTKSWNSVLIWEVLFEIRDLNLIFKFYISECDLLKE